MFGQSRWRQQGLSLTRAGGPALPAQNGCMKTHALLVPMAGLPAACAIIDVDADAEGLALAGAFAIDPTFDGPSDARE